MAIKLMKQSKGGEMRKQRGEIQTTLPFCLAIFFFFFTSLYALQSPRTCKPFCSSLFKCISQVALMLVKVNGNCKDGSTLSSVLDFLILYKSSYSSLMTGTNLAQSGEVGSVWVWCPHLPLLLTFFLLDSFIPAGLCARSYSCMVLCAWKTQIQWDYSLLIRSLQVFREARLQPIN